MRIVGVDKVPMTPFDRGDAPRKPVLTPIQLRTRRAKRALAARGMIEAVTWSFISKPQAELFDRERAATELALANPIAADLSDMRPSLLPGLVTAAQANIDRGFPDRGAVRGRPGVHKRRAGGSVDRGRRRSPWLCIVKGHGTALVRFSDSRMRSTPRPMRSRCWPPPARRCRRCRSCPAGPTGCIPGVPAPSRSARKTCWDISASCIRARWKQLGADGPLIAFEVILDRIPDAKAEADPRQAGARTVIVPAGVARLCLYRRSQRQGRRYRAIGAGRRQEADHRRHRVRRLRRQGHRRRQEVRRHRRDDPAARENPDRPGDRCGGRQNRGRGDEEDRRQSCADEPVRSHPRRTSASTPRSRSARSPSSRERRADFPASARR